MIPPGHRRCGYRQLAFAGRLLAGIMAFRMVGLQLALPTGAPALVFALHLPLVAPVGGQ